MTQGSARIRVLPGMEAFEAVDDLRDHPAASAWRNAGLGARLPAAIEVLKRPRGAEYKSYTFRLRGISSGGGSAVAKLCRREEAELERTVYDEILPDLDVSALRFYGLVNTYAGQRTDMAWLFIEDGGEARYSYADPAHRRIAAEWMARLHASAEGHPLLGKLPERGPSHYRRHLEQGLDAIERALTLSTLTLEEHATLEGVREDFALLAERWGVLEDLCRDEPVTLAHGDLVEKNARIRIGRGRPTLLVFDWEMCGRGLPAADLASSRADTASETLRYYRDAFVRAGGTTSSADVGRLAALGRLFRVAASVDWASIGLHHQEIEKSVANLEAYRRRLCVERERPTWRLLG